MKNATLTLCICAVMLFPGCANTGDRISMSDSVSTSQHMYVIERSVPGAGHLTGAELKAISRTSNDVLKAMDSDVQWLHSYITGDKIYSIYRAPTEELIWEHARKGGFPANSVERVAAIIDPSTATR